LVMAPCSQRSVMWRSTWESVLEWIWHRREFWTAFSQGGQKITNLGKLLPSQPHRWNVSSHAKDLVCLCLTFNRCWSVLLHTMVYCANVR
jgi:hypothetical protein